MISAAKSVVILTVYLITYVILINCGLLLNVVPYLLISFPFLLIWMVICILKDDKPGYPELKPNDEWGYRDKSKHDLGFF